MTLTQQSWPETLLDILHEADVLETFCGLPAADQQNFSLWIDRARDEESRWRRMEALVVALRMSPLQRWAHSQPSAGQARGG